MQKTIEYLKRDRKVNDTFKEKLAKVGLEISYETYDYWNNVECIRIGRSIVPLFETHDSNNRNSMSLGYRYQNDVIKDICNTLKREKEKAEESDKMVDDFFEKLGLKES